MTGLLDEVVAGRHATFALLHRPATGPTVDVLVGEAQQVERLADLALPVPGCGTAETLVAVPFRQIGERGFEHHDDGTPLRAIAVAEHVEVPLAAAVAALPRTPVALADQVFDPDDGAYAELVDRVVREEIGSGAGANFVLSRSLLGGIDDYDLPHALSLFRRLLRIEQGSYWTYLMHDRGHTLVGASPERHLTLVDGLATMNPISGTYRYPAGGATLDGITGFLADTKESDELYMVVDEELKMMSRLCSRAVRVRGPFLKEMTHLAHTEYLVEGRTDRDVRTLLRETLVAPTVSGSPVQSAARVIHRHEPHGRGYYSGVVALVGVTPDGAQSLDSTICIRSAEIDAGGRVRIGVGATLVRSSDAASEVLETRAKAATMLRAFAVEVPDRLGEHPDIMAALASRNADVARFWFREDGAPDEPVTDLDGLRALVVDAEDTFTSMIARQLAFLGLEVRVAGYGEVDGDEDVDLVVLGPGPGDPTDTADPRIAALHRLAERRLGAGLPTLAVCLSHQVLAARLGLDLRRRASPNQGVRRAVELFGTFERVGFYNTFSAVADRDKWEVEGLGVVEAARDRATGEVHALRGPALASMQFHPESLLTVDGPRLLTRAVREALGR